MTGFAMLDAVAYKNGQKNNWRRTAWNAIREVTPNTKSALVLYLPGESDLDRPVAQSKGFDSRNMIAVERNKKVVDSLRARKRTVIHGDLLDVMKNWPVDVPVSVVVADLQTCLNSIVGLFIHYWLTTAPFSNSAMLLNIQRGRESAADPIFKAVRDSRDLLSNKFEGPSDATNRAKLAVLLAAGAVHQTNGIPFSDENAVYRHIGWRVLSSYRSTEHSPLFDSVVFKNRGNNQAFMIAPDERDERMRRKISAALAIRTMRLSGQLACA